MKRLMILVTAALALGVFTVPSFSAPKAPTEPITMQVPEGAKSKKPTVLFPHSAHETLDCTKCHHTWDQKSEIKKCKASGCHDDVKSRKSERSYFRAYHQRGEQSCLGCHKTLKKAKAEKYGPYSCKDCHKKKK